MFKVVFLIQHKSLQSSQDEGTETCCGQAEWGGSVTMLHRHLASRCWEAAAPKALRAFWGLHRYGLISMSQHGLPMHSIIAVTFAPRRIQPDPSLHHFFLPLCLFPCHPCSDTTARLLAETTSPQTSATCSRGDKDRGTKAHLEARGI